MTHLSRLIRIGTDTGGTFTDVVAFDQGSDDLMYAGGRSEHLPPPGLGAHNESVRGWLDERDGGASVRDIAGEQR